MRVMSRGLGLQTRTARATNAVKVKMLLKPKLSSKALAVLRRGQVSLEYMLVVGFMFALLVPLLILYAQTQQDTTDSLSEGQVIRAGNTIRDVAERVYYAGAPSQEKISVTLPQTVTDSRIDNATMIFTLTGGKGSYDVAITGLAPLNGTLPQTPGRHVLIVRAEDGQVRLIPS